MPSPSPPSPQPNLDLIGDPNLRAQIAESDGLPAAAAAPANRSRFLGSSWGAESRLWALQEVLDLMTKPNALAWGFGAGRHPWSLAEQWAEPVLPWTTTQAGLFGYTKARGRVVTQITDPAAPAEWDLGPDVGRFGRVPLVPGTTQLVDPNYDEPGDHWLAVVWGRLRHDDIRAARTPRAYRSLGLYNNIRYTVTDQAKLAASYDTRTDPWFEVDEVSGNLVWLQHLAPPRHLTPRMEVDIRVLLRFAKAPAD